MGDKRGVRVSRDFNRARTPQPLRVEPQSEPQSGTRLAQVSRTVREVISGFATEELTDELIHEALAVAGLASLPEKAEPLREFAFVELRHALAAALGADAAEAIVLGLGPMLEVLERMDQRRTAPPPPGTSVAASFHPRSGPAKIARTAIITTDARLAVRVRLALGGGQEVARYASFAELGVRGRIHGSLIIDCRPLGGAPGLVAAAAEATTSIARTDVLLLFADVTERSALRGAHPAAGVIVCSSRDVGDEELADLLATFVGTR